MNRLPVAGFELGKIFHLPGNADADLRILPGLGLQLSDHLTVELIHALLALLVLNHHDGVIEVDAVLFADVLVKIGHPLADQVLVDQLVVEMFAHHLIVREQLDGHHILGKCQGNVKGPHLVLQLDL